MLSLRDKSTKDTIRKLVTRLPLSTKRRLYYIKAHRRFPRFKSPETFNEKVNWRIINDRRDEISWTCDKLRMKAFAEQSDTTVKVPKTLWSGVDITELANFDFPERWILKANHRSQCVFPGQGVPDMSILQAATNDWLENWQAEQLGEWAYAYARPLILLEEWIGKGQEAPSDYKFFVFNGRVELVQLDQNRFSGHQVGLYDREWSPLGAAKGLWQDAPIVPAPVHLLEMIEIAEKLGKKFDFMRIDLFDTEFGVFFGETTPYPGGGLSPFNPRSFDLELGRKWNLPR